MLLLRILAFLPIPAVSINLIYFFLYWIKSTTKSEVVPAFLLVFDLLNPSKEFKNVLYPTLGFPNIAIE